MQHFCAAAALLGSNMCENDTAIAAVEMTFINHLAEQGISYGTAEEYEFRLAQFQKLDAELKEINANPVNTYTVAHNYMSTWTDDEYNKMLGSKKDEDHVEADDEEIEGKMEVYPTSQDWTSHMMSVQNQGHCGSCWAFSAAGTIEGRHHMTSGEHVKLSEQQLVDCFYSRDGCQGGDHTSAQVWVGVHGLTTAESYPYKGVDSGKCLKLGGDVKTTGSIHRVSMKIEDHIAALQSGPVAVSLNASSTSWRNLEGGVLNDESCSTRPNHAIIAVGYSDDHWIVRNSWGAEWGTGGYGKILMKEGRGICGIQTHSDYMDTK